MADDNRVLCLGTFDLLHVGHLRLLERASQIGPLTVAVNTDAFAAKYKREPVCPLDHRIEMLRALRCVDRVIVNTGGADSKPAILDAKPRFIVHGDDWVGDDYMRQLDVNPKWLEEHGIDLLYLSYTGGVSTSALLRRANEIEFKQHNHYWKVGA